MEIVLSLCYNLDFSPISRNLPGVRGGWVGGVRDTGWVGRWGQEYGVGGSVGSGVRGGWVGGVRGTGWVGRWGQGYGVGGSVGSGVRGGWVGGVRGTGWVGRWGQEDGVGQGTGWVGRWGQGYGVGGSVGSGVRGGWVGGVTATVDPVGWVRVAPSQPTCLARERKKGYFKKWTEEEPHKEVNTFNHMGEPEARTFNHMGEPEARTFNHMGEPHLVVGAVQPGSTRRASCIIKN